MGTKKVARKPKGTVSLQELSNRRRFKYRYGTKEYFLTLPPRGTLNPVKEEQVRRMIELDILQEAHDNSQSRYKELLKPETSTNEVAKDGKFILHLQLKHFLEMTGRSLDKNIYYHAYRMALNWGDVTDCDNIPRLLNSMNYKPSTFNSRKTVLNAFCEWLVRKKQIQYNPLQDTKSRKRSAKLTTRKRLSDEEINLILEAIRTNQFLPKHSFRVSIRFLTFPLV